MKLALSSTTLLVATATVLVASSTGRYIWKQEHRPPILEVYVFTLAHGHATFIRTPDDKRILINGGGNAEVVRHLSRYLPFYSRRLDALIVTEPTARQVTGLIDIARRYTVDRAYIPAHSLETVGLSSTTDTVFTELLATLRTHKIPLERVAAGDQISVLHDVSLRAIFPVRPDLFTYSKASSPELVLTLSYGSTAVSLFGTATRKIQKYIASSTSFEETPHSHVLVMTHAGGANDLSAELLEKISPDFFVYSQTTSYSASKKVENKLQDDMVQMTGKRINAREYNVVRILSDGNNVDVLPERY